MEYVIVTISEARAHGIEILPTQRQSNDKTQAVIHANMVAGIDVFNQLKRYQYDDPEFIELLNSAEWTPEEGAEVPDENLGKIMAVQLLNDEVTKEINTYEFTDEESLEVKDFYPEWYEGVEIKNKEKWNHNGLLWQCLKKHTSSTDNEPSVDHADYWRVINNDHAGTLEDPIPYTPPMRLENKKYYIENGVTYRAIRNSGQSVTDKLSNLTGKYVEVAAETYSSNAIGTLSNPIPYVRPMIIYKGKYYISNGVVYKGIKDSESELNYTAEQIIDMYLEVV